MTTHAGVSNDVFHEVFESDEQCFLAAFDQSLEQLSRVVEAAATLKHGWLERVRVGVVALLGFFDDEPGRARVLVLDAPVNGTTGLECRQRLHDVLARLLDTTGGADVNVGKGEGERYAIDVARGCPLPSLALTGELVVGGVFSVLRTSMLESDGGKLVELAPSLMAFIVAPYLGQAAARVEREGRPSAGPEALSSAPGLSRAAELSRTAALPVRATHRTTLVLRAIAQTPYSNNREVAQAAGLVDEGQTSKLLARLERQGVIENVGIGAARGEPNAWLLTPSGRRALELIGQSFATGAPRPRSTSVRRRT